MKKLSEAAYAPYKTPEDYILEWTDRIWVTGGIGLIRDHYAPNLKVHGAYGTVTGAESIIKQSIMKKAAFPNRVMTGEDVIWEERGEREWVSSHRIVHAGSQEGYWVYGPPTPRRSVARNIALCLVKDAFVAEEWVVRDEYAVVEQLGYDPTATARLLAFDPNEKVLGEADADIRTEKAPSDPVKRGVSGPRPDRHGDECRLVQKMIEEVWNQRLLHLVKDYFHRDVICLSTRTSTVTRAEGYQRETERLIAPFPDGRVDVMDLAANRSDFHGLRVSALWRLTGTYCGVPAYGPITNSPISILGISHFLFRDGKLIREWRVYDEIAIMVEILRARGDRQVAD